MYCREHHVDLATVSNTEDMNQLVNTVQESSGGFTGKAWIGLHDNLTSWRWSLSDSSYYGDQEADYRNWGFGQPDNFFGGQMCVKMLSEGVWDDSRCSPRNPFICYDGLNSAFINRLPTGRCQSLSLKGLRLNTLFFLHQGKLMTIRSSFLLKRSWAGRTLSCTAGSSIQTWRVSGIKKKTRKCSFWPRTGPLGLASIGLQSLTSFFVGWMATLLAPQEQNHSCHILFFLFFEFITCKTQQKAAEWSP